MKTTISLVLVLALGLIASVANADFTFGEPTNLGPTVNSSAWDAVPGISPDGLSLYFGSTRAGGSGSYDLWVATRTTKADDWGAPVNLGPTVNSSVWDLDPSISADGLLLYFMSNRPGGSGSRDIWVTTRPTKDDDWATPVNLGPTVNAAYEDCCPDISADGLSLFFWSGRPGGSGGWDLWVTTRATVSDPWGIPVNLGPTVNSSAEDAGPSISSDGLSLFFFSERPGGSGGRDLWVTTRTTVSEPWGTPVNLGPTVNSASADYVPSISADGRTLFFCSNRPGGVGDADLWQVSIEPVVDLNGDGIVDSADMCIIVDHWGTDEPLCDIGPMPWGDGIVDVQDLIVLAEHLFEEVEVYDPTLVAHWALDEIGGTIAYDIAGTCNGTLLGAPVWQPTGGMVNGALQFDGVDDCILTGSIPNSIEGPFSVLAWVKGGAPGQVVISQRSGVNWLCADTSEGNLMTELMGTGRDVAILPSQAVITDGNWHRIGLVWDGSQRKLYLDDLAVAEDTLANLEVSEKSLFIGTGNAMKSGTYWSGLIDDVRIYNRAVTP